MIFIIFITLMSIIFGFIPWALLLWTLISGNDKLITRYYSFLLSVPRDEK